MGKLRDYGHEITFHWTIYPVKKPFSEFQQEAAVLSEAGLMGVLEADVYILLAHHDGTGVFTELGAALALAQLHGKLKLYAVATEIPPAMFHYHPAIVWKSTIEEVLAELA